MNGALEILKRERDEAAEQIRLLRGKIRDLDSAIQVLEGHPIASRPGRGATDLKASVLIKLNELGSEGGTPKEIAEALTREGRQTSDASVSSTLSRLKGESRVANRNGRWFATISEGSASQQPLQTSDWRDLDEDVPF